MIYFHVPIILLFSCLVFQEHNITAKNPELKSIRKYSGILIDRSAEKDDSVKDLDKDSLDNLLDILGRSFMESSTERYRGIVAD